jgi:hypothetical protein
MARLKPWPGAKGDYLLERIDLSTISSVFSLESLSAESQLEVGTNRRKSRAPVVLAIAVSFRAVDDAEELINECIGLLSLFKSPALVSRSYWLLGFTHECLFAAAIGATHRPPWTGAYLS